MNDLALAMRKDKVRWNGGELHRKLLIFSNYVKWKSKWNNLLTRNIRFGFRVYSTKGNGKWGTGKIDYQFA